MAYVNPIIPVSNKYGAPLGRHMGSDYLETFAPLYLRHVRLNNGGYDAGGAYWGLGQALWHVQDEDGNGQIFRAYDRDRAKAIIREIWGEEVAFHGEKRINPASLWEVVIYQEGETPTRLSHKNRISWKRKTALRHARDTKANYPNGFIRVQEA